MSNKYISENTGRSILCIILIGLLAMTVKVKAQKNADNNTPNVSQLKKQYGDKVGIVCLSSNDSYSYEYDAKSATPLIVKEVQNEQMMSLKDDYGFVPRFYYNDYEDVGTIKAFDKNNKRIDVFVADLPVENGSEFYSGERAKAFTMNFENTGDKGGYTGEIYYGDVKYFDEIDFRSYYPILQKTVSVSIPNWMSVELKEINFDGYNISKTVTKDDKTGNTVYTYTAKNLDRIHTEDGSVPSESVMFPHICILAKSYNDPTGKVVPIMGTIADYYKWSEKLVTTAGNNDETLKPVVSDIVKGKTTDLDKVKAIYYWVEDNIRYLAFENGIAAFKPSPCQDVLKNKYGDCKGMANLLVDMLKVAGFDARHTWLATKSLNRDFSIPTIGCCNHCICTLILGGKHYYLDATEEYASLNDNADRLQGRQVLVEDGDKYIVETIPVAPIDRNKTVINKTMTVNGDLVTGDAHYSYNGESKTIILRDYHTIPSDKQDKLLNALVEGDDANLSSSNVKTSDMAGRDLPVNLGYNFTLKNQVNAFDNDIYVNIDNDRFFGWTFDSTRECDYQFIFRYNYLINDTLKVPQGYSVKHIPDNLDKETQNYIFKVKVTQNGNMIIYHKELQILNEIIKKKDFKTWNADATELKKIYDDQVILTKK